MTVNTEVSRSTHAWTGVETSFATGFPADQVADLAVYFRTVAGVESLLTLGVHYSATLAPGTKIATVNPISLPAGTGTVVVQRQTPALVGENLVDGQDFSLAVIQQLHDRAAMRTAEDRATLDRAIVLGETDEIGTGAYDLQGTRLGNMAPGQDPNDAATVAQLQGIGGATGNVPPPVLGDVDKLLTAVGPNSFAWLVLALSRMPDGFFTANAAGLAKFVDGFLSADAAGRAKMADGFLSADAAGRAKMADGFLSADAAGRAKMADGFLSADAAGRAKMADKFVTLAKQADISPGEMLGRVSAGDGPIERLTAAQSRGAIGLLWKPIGLVDVPVAVGAVEFAIPAGYSSFRLSGVFQPTSASPGVDNSLKARLAYSGGAFVTAADYRSGFMYQSGATVVGSALAVVSSMPLSLPTETSLFTRQFVDTKFFQGNLSENPRFQSVASGWVNGTGFTNIVYSALYANNVVMDRLQLLPGAGNIGAGSRFLLEGF